ncbi:MAG: usg protein [Alphaproteobacteria bacterium]
MTALECQLRGYRLTTAEILYHLPDHDHLLQSFIWQDYDLSPRFPVLSKFLRFWIANIEGRLHSVRVTSAPLIRPSEFRHTESVAYLH